MDKSPNDPNQVRILPPDHTLLKKLGKVMLDSLFSPAAIAVAQQTIVNASDAILAEGLEDLKTLEKNTDLFMANPEANKEMITAIIANAFAIKVKAGLAEYELAAALANSLHSRCELLGDANLTPTNVAILKWHVESLKQILPLKIKGTGGDSGEAILAELKNLTANLGQPMPEQSSTPTDAQDFI